MLIPKLGRWLVGTVREGRMLVQVDGRFCARMRHRGASCRRCAESCPTGAVGLNPGPTVDQERCGGCGICAALCPTGALELQIPTDSRLLGHLVEAGRRNSSVVVACSSYLKRSGAVASSVVRVACLGRLDISLLVGAIAWGGRALQLVDGGCQGCSHATGRAIAEESVRLANGLLDVCGSPSRVSFVASLPSCEGGSGPGVEPADGISRRELLGMLVGKGSRSEPEPQEGLSLLERPPATVGPVRGEKAQPHFVPAKRQLLLAALRRFQPPTSPCFAPEGGPWGSLQLDGRCTGCRMCAFFCPTGALRKLDGQAAIAFTPSICTACGLCREICYRQAVVLSTEVNLAEWWDGKSLTLELPASHQPSARHENSSLTINSEGIRLTPIE